MKKLLTYISLMVIAIISAFGLISIQNDYFGEISLDFEDSGFPEFVRIDFEDSGFPEFVRIDFEDSGFPEFVRI